MTEAEALQRYDAFLWKQVYAFCRLSKRQQQPLDDFIQEARLAFLQHIRTHPETEWNACTLTIKGALYEYARKEYPLTVSHNKFSKVLGEKIYFIGDAQYEMEVYKAGKRHEDDHTDIDLRQALDNLSESDRQIICLKLEGMTAKEIGDRTGKTPQAISLRIRTIKRKIVA